MAELCLEAVEAAIQEAVQEAPGLPQWLVGLIAFLGSAFCIGVMGGVGYFIYKVNQKCHGVAPPPPPDQEGQQGDAPPVAAPPPPEDVAARLEALDEEGEEEENRGFFSRFFST